MAERPRAMHTQAMVSALVVERVRSDLAVLAAGGLGTAELLTEVDASIQRAVPHAAMCVSLLDPATSLATATFKLGEIADRESHDGHWCEVEFRGDDPTSFRDLLREGRSAVAMNVETDGDVARSPRMRDFMGPHFGFTDELRAIARHQGHPWGALAMMRDGRHHPFDAAEVAFVASVSATLAAGLRGAMLVRSAPAATGPASGPAVIVIREDDTVAQVNEVAEHHLAELGACGTTEGPEPTLAALVDGARRCARGESDILPRARVRVRSGRWLVLHASPLCGPQSGGTEVVVTIDEARAPDIVPLVVAAFDLTPREREVTELVLQGVSSRAVADDLHISVHTVQDHLKSIFEKAGVRSRRDLMVRILFDPHGGPGGDLAPTG